MPFTDHKKGTLPLSLKLSVPCKCFHDHLKARHGPRPKVKKLEVEKMDGQIDDGNLSDGLGYLYLI